MDKLAEHDWERFDRLWNQLHRSGTTLSDSERLSLRTGVHTWWNVALTRDQTLASIVAEVRASLVEAHDHLQARDAIAQVLLSGPEPAVGRLAHFLFRARTVTRPWVTDEVIDALLVGPPNTYWALSDEPPEPATAQLTS